jgi:hypothetical protein
MVGIVTIDLALIFPVVIFSALILSVLIGAALMRSTVIRPAVMEFARIASARICAQLPDVLLGIPDTGLVLAIFSSIERRSFSLSPRAARR